MKIIEINVSQPLKSNKIKAKQIETNPFSGARPGFPVGQGANIPFSKFSIKKPA